MKNQFTSLLATFCIVTSGHAQSGLYISSGTSFFITSNSVVAIDGIVLEPSANFTINGNNSLTRNTAIAHPASGNYIGRVFNWGSTVNSFTGGIRIYYSDSELKGIPEPNLTLNVHNGTAWAAYAAGVTRDGTNNIVTTTGLNNINLNELTLADAMAALPLTWGNVSAIRKDGQALVKWQTYDETAVDFFAVERRTAGTGWMPVGNSVAASNTTGVHTYSLNDASVSAATTYYRIKQVDINGRFTYSTVVSVGALDTPAGLIMYPNPASDHMVLHADNNSIAAVTVYGLDGRMITAATPKSNTYRLDVARLPAGIYNIQVFLSDGAFFNQSFIKQ